MKEQPEGVSEMLLPMMMMMMTSDGNDENLTDEMSDVDGSSYDLESNSPS
jgi:hypothetical protein